MNRPQIGFLGIGAGILFWSASVILAELRPSYSHVVNTISELGAIGTPERRAMECCWPMKRNPNWQGLYIVSVVLVVLTLAAALSLRGALPDGLAQRIGNAFFWAWFVVMSLKLVSLGKR